MSVLLLTLRQHLDAYERLMRLDELIGTLLPLLTMWGMWIANECWPLPLLVWIFVLGMLLMRFAPRDQQVCRPQLCFP
jgi:4-hydroxybenzoate polyprenyltransferase